MDLIFLYIWFAVMIITTIAAPIVRKKRRLKPLNTESFVVAGFAFATAISLFKVLLKVPHLQTELGWDATIALCISSGLGIYLCIKEVLKLFSSP